STNQKYAVVPKNLQRVPEGRSLRTRIRQRVRFCWGEHDVLAAEARQFRHKLRIYGILNFERNFHSIEGVTARTLRPAVVVVFAVLCATTLARYACGTTSVRRRTRTRISRNASGRHR